MSALTAVLKKHQHNFHQVIAFNAATQKIASLDLTAENPALNSDIFNNIQAFSNFILQQQKINNADYLVGGYNELRTMYSRSALFDGDEPRRLHIGLDIWAPAGTPVFAFMGGMVHSFAYNNQEGDYGATLILLHQLDTIPFYTLYGHICLADIAHLKEGQYLSRGQQIAHFGEPSENGNWPPHLHLQVINDIGLHKGDYPGVCRMSEKDKYLENCPDPDFITMLSKYL